ncbi:hypothetical protein GTO91_00250 [Heliobacterium undosum]|uniref:DsrE/DsrF-like family protein n=1 Tax=Heliomicrobium undosum TaxID=121734 RepID=A0A845L0B2_9FIRM|nr:DsrE family protein [Heliomicrobium undosum]MZP28154.1 hypothetical protein [Heliomicrobium undosum]
MKIIYHVGDMQGWPKVFNSLGGFFQVAPQSFDLLILANGPGVQGLVKTDNPQGDFSPYERLPELVEKGAKILACENALRRNNIDVKDLPAFVSTVSSSIVELAEKQAAGYSYIRA